MLTDGQNQRGTVKLAISDAGAEVVVDHLVPAARAVLEHVEQLVISLA